LPEPNLGGFSPVTVSAPLPPRELVRRLAAQPALLATQAFAEQAVARPLVPAARAQMRFERGGVRVTASSTAESALLLPLQFSPLLPPGRRRQRRDGHARQRDPHAAPVQA
jgi:hypothetical protein